MSVNRILKSNFLIRTVSIFSGFVKEKAEGCRMREPTIILQMLLGNLVFAPSFPFLYLGFQFKFAGCGLSLPGVSASGNVVYSHKHKSPR